MSASVFESFYECDWGDRARAARNERRQIIVKAQNHAAGVVRGRISHPVFGPGYELHYRRPGASVTDDVRMTPSGDKFRQTRAPFLHETEEQWEETPVWLAN